VVLVNEGLQLAVDESRELAVVREDCSHLRQGSILPRGVETESMPKAGGTVQARRGAMCRSRYSSDRSTTTFHEERIGWLKEVAEDPLLLSSLSLEDRRISRRASQAGPLPA